MVDRQRARRGGAEEWWRAASRSLERGGVGGEGTGQTGTPFCLLRALARVIDTPAPLGRACRLILPAAPFSFPTQEGDPPTRRLSPNLSRCGASRGLLQSLEASLQRWRKASPCPSEAAVASPRPPPHDLGARGGSPQSRRFPGSCAVGLGEGSTCVSSSGGGGLGTG